MDSVTFSAFSGSNVGHWVDARLSTDPQPGSEAVGPQSDVAHDLLAHLAKRMMEMNQEKQEHVEAFWLDLEGVTDAETLDALRSKGKWESSLWKAEACRSFVNQV